MAAWLMTKITTLSAMTASVLMVGPGLAQQAQQDQQPITLPPIDVIGTTPLSTAPSSTIPTGGGPVDITSIDRDKVPANTQTLTPQDFDHAKSNSVPDSLLQRVPSVFNNDTAVNPFQQDVQFRGFLASPTVGTPQGLAIYQNGVRVNEVFGDTVNWDFIPSYAVHRLDVVPNDPAFGLNALGGAISIQMKNGFNYQGMEAELRGGSFGRRAVTMQSGQQFGNVAAYVAADALNDDGWRDQSQSKLRRVFADIGARNDTSEFHVNYTGAQNSFGAAAATPIQLLDQRWSAIYTTPQTYTNRLNFVNAVGSHNFSDTLNIKANTYYRGFRQNHVDGNTSDVEECSFDPTTLCLDDSPLNGGGVPTSILDGNLAGSVDRTQTSADAYGASAQLTSTHEVWGHQNHFVVGASIDRGRANFQAASELGTVGSDLFVTGTGVIVNQPDGLVAPVNVITRNTYTGLYVTDTFDITRQLSLTAGGRLNVANIQLDDQLGTALNGTNNFQRFNPVIGATYKITPQITTYAGYSESNRAPTPSELGCADPARPCLLDNFLVSDPPLQQVVGRTWEAGFRGRHNLGDKRTLTWNVGAYLTDTQNDILNVPSTITGRGFFQNVGGTRREGVEAGVTYDDEKWKLFAGYSYINATFRDAITLSSPNNPFADAEGFIFVQPGNHLPSIPQHRFKAAAEYLISPEWKVGANLIAFSGQYLAGDQSNQNPKLPPYWVLNLHTTYQISKNFEAFALVQNLFDTRYYTFGTFFDTSEIPFLNLTDPRTLSPGAPFAVYAGLRVKL
jgi:iron complex outermembrane receptor protein